MTGVKTRGKMNNAFDPDKASALPLVMRRLLERRAEDLGPAYRLFYSEPVHIVRGAGCRLWDSDGGEYLDAYNNVVSVGHAHPRVVEAVHEQMRTLCTNTRYLHEGILDYAEQLLATFTGPVSDGHVMLTCTGSEANDLALRIAKYHTGHEGVIVTAAAFHGNSEQIAGISPSLGNNSPLGTWVRTVPAPDTFRISPEDLPQWFADRVEEQIRDLRRYGAGLAALVVDPLFTSDGIFAGASDLLGPATEVVHAAGGLVIADEVQSGFARTGTAMWGYQYHGVGADIVTLGKPMGNGYPVAGLVASRELLARFGPEVRYFNTFGGNTVAVAAAQATLDVIRDEGLLENARLVGAQLRAGLQELSGRHSQLADVRGAGLYLGVEILDTSDSRHPDRQAATAIVNGLRHKGILISATGPEGNVLKIRPPLVFTPKDADRLTDALADTLTQLDIH